MANAQLQRSLDQHYRALYQRVRSLLTGVERGTIGVTSCVSGEGVTTVAAQLAQSFATEQEQPVLFIDANTHSPSPTPGLSNILLDSQGVRSENVQSLIVETSIPGLSRLPSGTGGELTYSADRFQQLLAVTSALHPWTIVDLPPAGERSDTLSLGQVLDGVLLVVEAERVRNQIVRRTKEQLLQGGSTLLGVVFNKRKNHVPDWLYRRL